MPCWPTTSYLQLRAARWRPVWTLMPLDSPSVAASGSDQHTLHIWRASERDIPILAGPSTCWLAAVLSNTRRCPEMDAVSAPLEGSAAAGQTLDDSATWPDSWHQVQDLRSRLETKFHLRVRSSTLCIGIRHTFPSSGRASKTEYSASHGPFSYVINTQLPPCGECIRYHLTVVPSTEYRDIVHISVLLSPASSRAHRTSIRLMIPTVVHVRQERLSPQSRPRGVLS